MNLYTKLQNQHYFAASTLAAAFGHNVYKSLFKLKTKHTFDALHSH